MYLAHTEGCGCLLNTDAEENSQELPFFLPDTSLFFPFSRGGHAGTLQEGALSSHL